MTQMNQYNSQEGARGRMFDHAMYRSFDQDFHRVGMDMLGSGKRTGFGMASTVPMQPMLAAMPYLQLEEQPRHYTPSVQAQDVVFCIENEMAQQVFATEIPQYAELVYVPEPQAVNWSIEQAPPLLRRPHSSRQEPVTQSKHRPSRERASRPSEPEVLVREVPVEKIVEVVKEVVKIVEVLKEVEVTKDHFIFKEVPVEKPVYFDREVPVERIVEREKVVEKEVPVEKIVEVPVERIVEKLVLTEVPVHHFHQAAQPIPTIIHQTPIQTTTQHFQHIPVQQQQQQQQQVISHFQVQHLPQIQLPVYDIQSTSVSTLPQQPISQFSQITPYHNYIEQYPTHIISSDQFYSTHTVSDLVPGQLVQPSPAQQTSIQLGSTPPPLVFASEEQSDRAKSTATADKGEASKLVV